MGSCAMRPLCQAMTELSCNPARQPAMRRAVARCKGAECFRLFADELREEDDAASPGTG